MKEEYHLHENVPRQLQPSPVSGHKKRHGCLTAFLIFLILGGLNYLYILSGSFQSQTIPPWQQLFVLIVAVLDIVWIIALFKWKKWGFWGYCLTASITIIHNIVVGANILEAFYPIIGLAFLYGVLQIGGENKGWTQLEGFGTRKIFESEDIEMTEQEGYQPQPTSQAKDAKTAWERVKVKIWSKEVLLGGIAGFIGVLVSSFGTAMALEWNSVGSGAGYGYIFGILICIGYPLVGAFLGGVSGFYTSVFLYRYYDADVSLGVGIIFPLFVGFVVGLLAGIAPYILLYAWFVEIM